MVAVRPLDGLRVLDLARVLAGPFVGRMLADLGADVVKVEPPEGDVTRHFGVRRGTQSSYYVQWNAGKRNVSIDLRAEGGAKLVRRLASVAGVVVENFRPGVLAAHGLDWPALSAVNPRLVMLSISGFGQEGPEAQRAAYAGIIHAESGFVARQAEFSGGPLSDARYSAADTITGLHGLVGILAALRVAEQTGVGQHVDVSMMEAFVATDDYAHWALEGQPIAQGAGEVWETRAGPILLAGDFRWIWRCATEHLGLVDPTPPGAPLDRKIELRRRAWGDHLLSFEDRAGLVAELDRANIAWGEVKAGAGVFDSPTLAHRGTVVAIDDRAGGSRPVLRSPYRFSQADSGVAGPAPLRGEHNRQVLAGWLGASDGEIDELVASGVLQQELRRQHEGGGLGSR